MGAAARPHLRFWGTLSCGACGGVVGTEAEAAGASLSGSSSQMPSARLTKSAMLEKRSPAVASWLRANTPMVSNKMASSVSCEVLAAAAGVSRSR